MASFPSKIIISLLICVSSLAHAQVVVQSFEQEKPVYQLFHVQPKLPPALTPLQLGVSTSALKKGSYRIEAIISRDGKSYPASFHTTGKNAAGKSAYVFNISAPEKELRYTFYLRDGENKTLAKTEEFTLIRTCNEEIVAEMTTASDDPNTQVLSLAQQAQALETEIARLHNAFRLAEVVTGRINGNE